jgi:hypothetical protein
MTCIRMAVSVAEPRTLSTMQRKPKPLTFGLASTPEVGNRIDRIRARAERDRQKAAMAKTVSFRKPSKSAAEGKIR